MRVRVGTRGSRLALAQSHEIGELIESTGHEVEYVVTRTSGDEDRDRPFQEIGEPGVFVREIEEALLRESIDLAVHSYKDLPSESPAGLVVAAVPQRLDARDVLLSRSGFSGDATLPLAEGAVVGTASARRKALLAELRPDLRVKLLRGNLPTRVRKLEEDEYDAILLAAAGLIRLRRRGARNEEDPFPDNGMAETPLDPRLFVPAPSQGALALQVRDENSEVRSLVESLNDDRSHKTVRAERALLRRVKGGCSVPFGAWCRMRDGDQLELHSFWGAEEGFFRACGRGRDPEELAREVWRELRSQAGA